MMTAGRAQLVLALVALGLMWSSFAVWPSTEADSPGTWAWRIGVLLLVAATG